LNSIIEMLEAPVEEVIISNLGPGINSSEGEYSPVVSTNGKKLYFARDCGECNGGEEVQVSVKGEDGLWGQAKKFGEPLSSRGHETPMGISADGNMLAIYGNYDDSLGRGDLYYVAKTTEGWSELRHYPAPINSEHFDSNAMYTADGMALLFVSERPGGVGDYHKKDSYYHGSYGGNTDIYVYVTDLKGGGNIYNLGPVINTPYSEYTPYLHPDGRTLYFSSDGHPGLGGLDVFKSTRINGNSWTEWSEPVNIGKEINTSTNDWGYQFYAPGDKAFFSASNRAEGMGGNDIFSVSLPQKIQPVNTVITVSGTVTDPDGDALVADIRWNDLVAEKEVGHATSDPITGEYLIHLPSGGKYGYYADKKGYIGESEHFDLRDDFEYKEYVLDIVLYPIPAPVEPEPAPEPAPVVVAEIRMNNIFFDFNKSDLRRESLMELGRWVNFMQDNPAMKIEISGHADSVGTEDYNMKLSLRRAQAVVNYLVGQGVTGDRLTAQGFGESMPVVANDTDEGRQQNRRVEVKIINTNGNGM